MLLENLAVSYFVKRLPVKKNEGPSLYAKGNTNAPDLDGILFFETTFSSMHCIPFSLRVSVTDDSSNKRRCGAVPVAPIQQSASLCCTDRSLQLTHWRRPAYWKPHSLSLTRLLLLLLLLLLLFSCKYHKHVRLENPTISRLPILTFSLTSPSPSKSS